MCHRRSGFIPKRLERRGKPPVRMENQYASDGGMIIIIFAGFPNGSRDRFAGRDGIIKPAVQNEIGRSLFMQALFDGRAEIKKYLFCIRTSLVLI